MIAIINYNAGNILSVQNALNRLGYENILTNDIDTIQNADKVIFPGVGEASSAMRYVKERQLDQVICNLAQPVLGICLGLQLMCESSEEGDTHCLGIFDAQVKRFPALDIVPHMGWNLIEGLKSELFKSISSSLDVYFVHSYYAEICSQTVATGTYITPFSAALQKDNFYAVQFHPEKSADFGEQILMNFLKL